MLHSWDCSPITTKNTVRLREKVKADSVQTVEINSRGYLIWKLTLFLPLWGPEDYQCPLKYLNILITENNLNTSCNNSIHYTRHCL